MKLPPTPACRGDVPWTEHMAVHEHISIPLFEARISTEILHERLKTMSSREFARSFRQRAISEEDILFKPDMIARCKVLGKDHAVVTRVDKGDYWHAHPRIAGVDLAIGQKDDAAYFVIFVIAITPNMMRWPLYLFRERGVSFGKQIEMILDVEERFRCSLWMVENNNYQEAIIQHLGERSPLAVQGLYTGEKQKRDLEIGLPSMATEWEHGHWAVPQKDERSRYMMEPWLDELGTYPGGTYSDTVMASFFAREAVREGRTARMRIVGLT